MSSLDDYWDVHCGNCDRRIGLLPEAVECLALVPPCRCGVADWRFAFTDERVVFACER